MIFSVYINLFLERYSINEINRIFRHGSWQNHKKNRHVTPQYNLLTFNNLELSLDDVEFRIERAVVLMHGKLNFTIKFCLEYLDIFDSIVSLKLPS